jgi:hypothetical protein
MACKRGERNFERVQIRFEPNIVVKKISINILLRVAPPSLFVRKNFRNTNLICVQILNHL